MIFKKPKLKFKIVLPIVVFAVFATAFFGSSKKAEAFPTGWPSQIQGEEITYEQIDFKTEGHHSYKKANGEDVTAGNSVRIGEDVTGLLITIGGTNLSPASLIVGYKDGWQKLKFPVSIVPSVTIWGFGTMIVKDDTACSVVSVGGTIWNIGGQSVKTCDYKVYMETVYSGPGTPTWIEFKPGANIPPGAPGAPANQASGGETGGFVHGYPMTVATLKSTYGIKTKAEGGTFDTNCINIKSGLATQSPAGANITGMKFLLGVNTYWVKRNNKFCFEIYKTQAEADADTSPVPPVKDDDGTGTSDTTKPNGGGSTIVDFINQVITILVLAQTRIIYWVFASVLAPLIEALLKIHPYQDVFVEAIYLGWQLIRNLCNIFFIVVLLVIGLGTLFRVESYNYKHLLVKVVIAALLVNFSLVFGQAILGVADTVQQQFLPDSQNVIRALGSKLMVEPINELTSKGNYSTGDAATAGASFAGLAKPVFAFILALGAFFTFVALAAFLVIRIVALWILLLVSPIAYVANILPNTAQYSKDWWQKFLKYAFMTPILAFFLNLSAVFATTMLRDQAHFSKLLSAQNVDGDIAQFVYLAGSQILIILFILVGLKAASSSGTYGAAAVTNFAEKGIKKPFEWYGRAAKAGAERGFEGIQNKMGVTLDPRLIKKAGSEYFAEQKSKRLQGRATRSFMGIDGAPKFGDARSNFEAYANWRGVKRATLDSRFGTKGAKHYEKESNKLKPYTKLKSDQERGELNNIIITNNEKLIAPRTQEREMNDEISKLEAQNNDPNNGNYQKLGNSIDEKKALLQQLQEKEINPLVKENKKAALELKDDTANRKKLGVTKFDATEKTAKLNEMEEYDNKVAKLKRPEGYAAIAAHHNLISEEKKKIEHIDEADRLIQLYKNAVAQGDRYKGEAVMQKLAKDTNFNELLEEQYGQHDYNTFVQHFTGKDKDGKDTGKGFAKDFGLSEHEALESMSEVSYINEGNHMFNAARAIEVDKHGNMNALSEEDHNKIIATQMGKVEAQRQAREFWRGSFLDEKQNVKGDPSKGKTFRLHDAGIEVLTNSLGKGENVKHVAIRMQEYNRNAILKAINKELDDEIKDPSKKARKGVKELKANQRFMDALQYGDADYTKNKGKGKAAATPPEDDDEVMN